MKPTFRLTVFQSGTVARLPVEMDEETLQEALLMASFFDADKVKTVLDCAKRLGLSEYTEGRDRPVYVVESLFEMAEAAEMVPSDAASRRSRTHLPDKPIWAINTR